MHHSKPMGIALKSAYKVFSAIMAGLLAAVIFFLSEQRTVESNLLSQKVVMLLAPILRMIEPIIPFDFYSADHLIRKGMHFFLFFLLAFFLMAAVGLMAEVGLMGAVGLMAVAGKKRQNRFRTAATVFFLCAAYAAGDEIHQLFVARGAQVSDVVIDMAGALTGIIFMYIPLKLADVYTLISTKKVSRSGKGSEE